MPSAQIWRWRVQPAVGSVYQMRLFARVQVRLPATDKDATLAATSTVKMTAKLEALARDAAGATTMKLTIQSLDGSHILNEGVTAAQKRDAENRVKYGNARTARAMIGQSLQFALNCDGTVAQLKDEKFSARTLHIINSLQSSPPLYTLVKNFGGYLPGLFLAPAPDAPLRVGQTWNSGSQLPRPSDFILQLQGQRALKSLNGGVALIAENSTASAPAELTAEFPYDISGQASGTARVDMKSGMPMEINRSLRLQPNLVYSNAQGEFEMRLAQENSQVRVVFAEKSTARG